MILLNILRMVADVAFYGAFAGYIAGCYGGSGAMVGAMLQSICFGLSFLGGQRRSLRLLFLLPMLGCWAIYNESLPDCIMLLPTAAYIVWLVWKNDYALTYERQNRLFGTCWKMLLPFSAVFMLWGRISGNTSVLDISLPYGLVMLVSSVLLMRTLRHDKQIYCQRRYQIVNYSIVALLLVVAGVLSSDVFLNGCKAVLGFLYRILLKPILQLLLKVLELIIWLVYKLYELIAGEQDFHIPEDVFSIEMGESDPILESLEIEGAQEKSIWLILLGWGLLIAVVGLGLMFFFRWMNQRGSADPDSEEEIEIWETDPLPIFSPWKKAKKQENSEMHKIRTLYRGFLKWCLKRGVQTRAHHTSLDVHQQFGAANGCEATSAQIRELYINARYAGRADQDGAKHMKKLCAQIRQEVKNAEIEKSSGL